MSKNTIKTYFKKKATNAGTTTQHPSQNDRNDAILDDSWAQASDYSEDTGGNVESQVTGQLERHAPKERLQRFRQEWAINEYSCFKAYESDPFFTWCVLCLDKLNVARGGRSNLTSHLKSKRHVEAAKKINSADSAIDHHFANNTTSRITAAEIKLVAWAVEGDIPFLQVEKLTDILRSMDGESPIFSKLKLARTKTTAVVDGVLGEHQHAVLVGKMRKQHFSLLIDEATDISTKKGLALVVRIAECSAADFQIRDEFYGIIEMGPADHRSIYDVIVGRFESDCIDYKKNLRGFASDGAAVMQGSRNSVAQLLKTDCPELIIVRCICHSLALCASNACKQLPDYCEQLLRDIYSYFSSSPKRTAEFALLQEILELKPLKLFDPAVTRWLSLEAVVKRCLERLDELTLFFSLESKEDTGNETAARILSHLKDQMTKPLLSFLNYILPIINRINKLFQSEQPEITVVHDELSSFLFLLLSNVCQATFVATAPNIDIQDFKKHLKDLDQVYVGIMTEKAIKEGEQDMKFDITFIQTFKRICRNFYIELILQVTKRFDLKDTVLKTVGNLNPSNFDKIESIDTVIEALPGFHVQDRQAIENEFRQIKLCLLRNTIEIDKNINVLDWWKTTLKTKRGNGDLAFPLMQQFILDIFIIPHSSASVERIFSAYNRNKTKIRNRLSMETMDGILKAKQLIKNEGGALDFKENNELLNRFTKEMYKHHRKHKSLN